MSPFFSNYSEFWNAQHDEEQTPIELEGMSESKMNGRPYQALRIASSSDESDRIEHFAGAME